jgi:hypothetical protein
MKSKKVFKRIAKIEALISEVTERSSQSAPHVLELLRDAKAAVIRAKKALSLEASSGTAKNPPAKGAKPSVKATPEPSRPKRKLSAAGRRAISEATKKRWAAFHVAQEGGKPKAGTKAPAKATAKAAPKRKLSAAAKAKLVANLAKARAAKKAKATSGESVPF